MKRLEKNIRFACLAALAIGFAACSQDELSPTGTAEGTAVRIGSVSIGGEVETRVSENPDDGGKSSLWDFDGTERIAVQVKDGVQGVYTLMTDKSVTADQPTYWTRSGSQTINAWYPVACDNIDLSNQSAGHLAYALFASATGTYPDAVALNFSHSLAKLRVRLKGDVELIEKIVARHFTSCSLNTTDGTVTGNDEGDITLTKANYGTETYWEANFAPGAVANDVLRFNDSFNAGIASVTQFEAGKIYTATYTVMASDIVIFEGYTLAEWKPAGDDIEAEPTPGQLYAIDDDGTYLVSSAAGLMAWAEMARKDPTISCRLTGNFTLPSTYKWTPIGDGEKPFSGTFDGRGYNIRNLKVNSTVTDSKGRQVAGMFGEVTGTVKSVQLYGSGTGIEVESDQPGLAAGMVAGTLTDGTISNCTSYPYDYIVAKAPSDVYVGGVVGYNDNGFVAGNEFVVSTRLRGIATANDGTAYVGGVAGANVGKDAVVIGSLSAAITESYVDSPASTTNYAGGILGYAAGGSTCTGNAVWCSGSQVSSHGGGVLGYAADTDIAVNNCYWYYSSGSSAVGAYATGSSGDYSGISSNARVSNYYDMTWLTYVNLLQSVVYSWNAANDRKCNAYFYARQISSGSTGYYPILAKQY